MNISIKASFAKGIAFALGIFATGLFAITVTGVINTFASGEPVSSSKINENFQTLKTAIEELPLGNYCGQTAATTGNLGGHTGAKALCETACGNTKAHMCTAHELSIAVQSGNLATGGEMWYSSFGRMDQGGVPISQNECQGWISSGTNYSANTISPPNAIIFRTCNNSYPVACCL